MEAKSNANFLLNFIKLKSLINLQERLSKFKQNNEINATKLKNVSKAYEFMNNKDKCNHH